MEQWKIIDNYPNYSVSNLGNVRNDRKNNILKCSVDKSTGYKRTALTKENKHNQHYVHRLVAGVFIENLAGRKCVDHIDNDRTNNNIDNLRWATHQENQRNCTKFKNCSTGKTGVHLHKMTGKYTANITINYRTVHLGYFKTIEEAIIARKNAVDKHYGIYQKFNDDFEKFDFIIKDTIHFLKLSKDFIDNYV